MHNRIAQNMVESDFSEKSFSGQKYRKSPFLQIFIGLFPYILLFFHSNIIYNNVHHQAWLNCQYNWFLLSELFKNPRNSRFSPEKLHFLNFSSCTLYFFIKFCTLIRNGNAQKVTEPDFVKTFFPAENAGNMRGKPAFGHFLEISSFH